MADIEKVYLKLAAKYKLPNFKNLNSEFELSDFESTNFVLRNIMRKAAEKTEFYANVIGDTLQPDAASLSSMHETRFFTDSEKSRLYLLYKKMMKIHRGIIEVILKNDEKQEAEFLSRLFDDWIMIKKELAQCLEKMKDSWDKETSTEEDLGYFG